MAEIVNRVHPVLLHCNILGLARLSISAISAKEFIIRFSFNYFIYKFLTIANVGDFIQR